MESKFKLPTETVELPSKGLMYPKDSVLSSGKVEMKYMTAREEDILTNQSYIVNGTVIDRLLKALIVSDINYDDILVGDKNAIMVAARILSYGKDYQINYNGESHIVDLSLIDNKPIDESLYQGPDTEFIFTLPAAQIDIKFKLLTHGLEKKIDSEIKGLKKIQKDNAPESTIRLKHMITEVDGSRDRKEIRDFVDNYFLARDARAFREYYNSIQPDVDMEVTLNVNGEEEVVDLPITLNFFWPDA